MIRMKRVHRDGRYHKRSGKEWISARDASFERAGGICEVSGEDLFLVIHGEDCTDGNCQLFDEGYCRTVWRRACHHIIAERYVRKFFPGVSPHIAENLVAVTTSLHSRLTAAENRLFKADWLGYRRELHRLGMDLAILDRAFSALCAAEKKK